MTTFVKRSMRLLVATLGGTAVAAALVAAWFVLSHRQSVTISAAAADAEFARMRSRLNQHALTGSAGEPTTSFPATTTSRSSLRSFHTVIFDTRGGGRLVRISVPYWFGRMYARHSGEFHWLGELTFLDDTEFDSEAIRLSLAQIERRGPGLVADYRRDGGGQFLSWVE